MASKTLSISGRVFLYALAMVEYVGRKPTYDWVVRRECIDWLLEHSMCKGPENDRATRRLCLRFVVRREGSRQWNGLTVTAF